MHQDPLVHLAFSRKAEDPLFIAHRLAQLRQAQSQTPTQQAQTLGIDLDALVRLALCHMPRPEDRTAAAQIALYVGLDVGQMMELLRRDRASVSGLSEGGSIGPADREDNPVTDTVPSDEIDQQCCRSVHSTRRRRLAARTPAPRRGRPRKSSLTVEQVLVWADAYHERTGQWPIILSGLIPEAPGESWVNINQALRRGFRGLPCSFLARLLHEHRRDRPIRPRALPTEDTRVS